MSSPDLEKLQKHSPSSSNLGLANDARVAYDETQEETLHRGLKARQVSQSFSPFIPLTYTLNRYR